jgi:hypothetical protein
MIDFNKIKTECPKAYELFGSDIQNLTVSGDYLDLTYMFDMKSNICFSFSKENGYIFIPVPMELFFGKIVDFFDKHGITITISKINKTDWISYIDITNETSKCCNDRKEAQTEATYGAFRILEERLK